MELFKVRFISELYEEIASFWSESTEFVLRTEENYGKRIVNEYGVFHDQRCIILKIGRDGWTELSYFIY